ncbi:MAG TPA: hypothetical protein VGI66_03475 [Streptosporangiaceae bacterium]
MTFREMELAIDACLTGKYGPRRIRPPLPEGLRLEMHPSVYNQIVRDPTLRDFTSSGRNPQEMLAERWQVPVRIAPELDRDTWRLVIVTEEVLMNGALV